MKYKINSINYQNKQDSNEQVETKRNLDNLIKKVETIGNVNNLKIDTFYKLIKLHSKLFPTINTNDDTDILQIGDFVRIPQFIVIFKHKKAIHSHYETSEVRLIQEMIMKKN